MRKLAEGPLFPGVRFARVLSLGASETTRGSGAVVIPYGSETVFDRLVAPSEAIAEILADDGARLGLHFVASDAGETIQCGSYDVLYPDAFRRDDAGQIIFATQDIESCRAGLARSMMTFLQSCEDACGPVLFLRSEAGAEGPSGCSRNEFIGPGFGAAALSAALARRFPALDFRLIVLVSASGPGTEIGYPQDGRIVFVFPPSEGDAWHQISARLSVDGCVAAVSRPKDGDAVDVGGDSPLQASSVERGGGGVPRQVVSGASADAGQAGPALIVGDAEAALSDLPVRLNNGSAAPDLAWRIGSELWRGGRAAQAVDAFALAYAHGCRDLKFLRDYLGLLTGETRYREVIDLAASLRRDGFAEQTRAMRHLAMLAGHAKLALAYPRESEIARAGARTASPAWLDAPTLMQMVAAAIDERRPFAFIRLGDGEARYLLGESQGGPAGLAGEETHAMGDLVWENWFGAPLSSVDVGRRAGLHVAFADAVRAADVVGASGAERLRADTGHYGYLAWLEAWLRDQLAEGVSPRFADAQAHRRLNADTPFLAKLLQGQDVLGVISPHPALADALGTHLGIEHVLSHVVPAEGRLPDAAQSRETLGPHFPYAYDRLLASLTVPRPGCVFLVAAGLLGKIYCARIKALGGVAIDIGALADAWMGHDTRDGEHAGVATLPQIPQNPPAEGRTTHGCLSMGKTGSMALTAAMHAAGIPDAVHLHFLGPQALAIKRADPEPMLDLAVEVAGRLEDPEHAFRLVTAVRDPIARLLSQAFYRAERHRAAHGVDIVRDPAALIEWWEGNQMARHDLWSLWFDDTFKATFGFDFRHHPFDHARRSLRYESGRLKLLVLRQEDDRSGREAELGWLLDRDGVKLRPINDAANQGYEAAYRPFLESFVAPSAWLDAYYETEVIRHFYTEEERAMFRKRWGLKTRVATAMPHPDAMGEPIKTDSADTEALGETVEPDTPIDPVMAAVPAGAISAPPSAATALDIAAELGRAHAELEALRSRLRDGHAVDFHDYAYRPRERDWTGSAGATRLRALFAEGEGAYAGLLERFCAFDDQYRAIQVLPGADGPHWENWWLPGLDAVALYGLVATLAPRIYLEIGSGHSTRFVRRAIRDHGLSTRIVSVDPNPTTEINALCDEVVRARCEDAPAHLFASLQAGDMMFFDGGHRSFQNSDATVFFTEILPDLAPGVVYGVHDVFLPYDYPESWTDRFYNEQYLLMTYLLGGAGGDEVVFPAHHVWREPAYAPLRNRLFLGSRHLDWLTSSFWMRRAGVRSGVT